MTNMKVFEPMKINGLDRTERQPKNLLLITNTKQKADGQIESHRKLTERVHAAGGKIAAQIYHAGRETSSAVTGV